MSGRMGGVGVGGTRDFSVLFLFVCVSQQARERLTAGAPVRKRAQDCKSGQITGTGPKRRFFFAPRRNRSRPGETVGFRSAVAAIAVYT